MTGIVSYGVYLPYWRLRREAITAALGTGGGSGTRSVASYDEDSTSMGVEAARRALATAPESYNPSIVAFATTSPAYLDRTNANAVHAALALAPSSGAVDCLGSARSAIAATTVAAARGGLAVLSDIRIGLPGGSDEAWGGDAAVALAMGDGPDVIAELVAESDITAEFMDRWRQPGELASRQWEERFGEHAYLPLVEQSVVPALKSAGLGVNDIDHVVVTGLHARAVKAARRALGARPATIVDDLTESLGNTGTPHFALMLADVLDRAAPDETIAIVHLADGCSTWVMRTTDNLRSHHHRRTVRHLVAAEHGEVPYTTFLGWRGLLRREAPRRPEPDRPAAPPSARSSAWKFGLVASRDRRGFVHMPPARVSAASDSIDDMEPIRMADATGTIATFTIDRLAFSPSPPVVSAVVDFDGGGRLQCELTDVEPSKVMIGTRVQMTFRRLYTTADGVHNYFWKARPLTGAG